MKKQELIELMTFLSEIYQKKFEFPKETKEDSESMIRTWMVFLKEIPFKPAMFICKAYNEKGNEWPPTPGEIVKAYKDAIKPTEERTTPEEAWEKALSIAIGSSYYDSDGKIMDERGTPERIKRTISAIGGLERIRCSRKDDPFFRKAFIDTYNSISERITQEPDKNLIEAIREDVKEITNNMRMLKQ